MDEFPLAEICPFFAYNSSQHAEKNFDQRSRVKTTRETRPCGQAPKHYSNKSRRNLLLRARVGMYKKEEVSLLNVGNETKLTKAHRSWKRVRIRAGGSWTQGISQISTTFSIMDETCVLLFEGSRQWTTFSKYVHKNSSIMGTQQVSFGVKKLRKLVIFQNILERKSMKTCA